MELQFRRNVEGFYDVEDQLPRYLRRLADAQFAAADETRAGIESREDAEERGQRAREHFLDAMGGLPDESGDLDAATTNALERDGYAIEHVVFESLPDFHVTANLYLPDEASASDPVPGVLFLCGHAGVGKAAPVYQKVCVDLVENGFAVLAVDPLGQGERHQFYDPETGELPRENVLEHTYLAQQCTLAGANVARYFVRDGVRALDYLTGRPEVDEGRVGATGNSGGGMQTGYLMLADDRIDAAVPCCFVTSKEEYMKTGQAQDGEQILWRAIERGPRFDDFVAAFAPKPVRIGSAQSDFLCIEGVHRTYERARRVYDRYDAADGIDLAVSDTTHGFSPTLRQAAVNWFREHLQGRDADFETGDPATEEPADLECVSDGEVRAAYPEERTVVDLNREFLDESAPDANAAPDVDDPSAYASDFRETAVERFELDRERVPLFPRTIERESEGDVTWEKVFFRSERDVMVTALVASVEDPAAAPGDPLIALYDHGTDEVPERESEVAALVREHGVVVVFDPRGVGGVRARDVNTPLANGGEYEDTHGTVYKLASDALMLGTSLFALQLYDVLRAIEYLGARSDDGDRVALRGEGTSGFLALLAAAVEPSVGSVTAVDVEQSLYGMATSEEYDEDPRLNVYDAVGSFDVPQLLPALAGVDVEWDGATPDVGG